MLENDEYLDDFLEEQNELQVMRQDSDKVKEQAYQFAKNNVDLFDTVSKLMEDHNTHFETYKQKCEELRQLEAECDVVNKQRDVNAVRDILRKEKAALFKEADDIKKAYQKSNLSEQEFIAQY